LGSQHFERKRPPKKPNTKTNDIIHLMLQLQSTVINKFNVHGTVHHQMCILYNQRDATYTTFIITISALHVSGGSSGHHQELIKLYVQLWVLPCFPADYRSCGRVGTHTHER